jgi:hypothetical protein
MIFMGRIGKAKRRRGQLEIFRAAPSGGRRAKKRAASSKNARR